MSGKVPILLSWARGDRRSDDLAVDVRSDYRELLEDQVPDQEATRRVLELYRALDSDEEPVFGLAPCPLRGASPCSGWVASTTTGWLPLRFQRLDYAGTDLPDQDAITPLPVRPDAPGWGSVHTHLAAKGRRKDPDWADAGFRWAAPLNA